MHILCRILKSTFGIPHRISYPYTEDTIFNKPQFYSELISMGLCEKDLTPMCYEHTSSLPFKGKKLK